VMCETKTKTKSDKIRITAQKLKFNNRNEITTDRREYVKL